MKVAFALLLSLFLITPVQAHEIKSIGSLAVLLHMEPDDSPIVGQSAQLIFAFTDVSGVFNVKNCDCNVIVSQKDKQIFKQNLQDAAEGYGSNAAQIIYTFPKKGIYQVTINGKPKPENNFNSFSLTYNVRIERENADQSPVDPLYKQSDRTTLIYGIAAIVGVAMIILGIKLSKNKK